MSAKFFVDSNIFLYAFCDRNKDKQKIASDLIQNNITISTQVVNEVSSNMLKKLKFDNSEIQTFIESCYRRYTLVNFNLDIFVSACHLREQYSLSYYDSLIISSALSSHSEILYSEDMQHQLLIDNQLTIINPFI
ncbi:MAG: PIN domain-containing protein [Gammaproteobacteria bacterium]|nr:PIN domain-containing protein [Gammaproteobacteria bacterium]